MGLFLCQFLPQADAIRFYIGYLQQGKNVNYLAPVIAQMLFKLAVEFTMVSELQAAQLQVTDAQMDDLRQMCSRIVAENTALSPSKRPTPPSTAMPKIIVTSTFRKGGGAGKKGSAGGLLKYMGVKTTGEAGGLHRPYKGLIQPRLKAYERFANRNSITGSPLPVAAFYLPLPTGSPV